MTARAGWRRFRLGLATLLGRKRGFFIPYRYAATLPDAATLPPYAPVERMFQARRDAFAAVLDELAQYRDALEVIAADRSEGAPRFDQDWFPTLDAVIAYRMVRALQPARIVEIGSGHSTRFLARAIRDGGFSIDLIAIDPQPRAAIRALPIRHIAATVPPRDAESGCAVDAALGALQAGDILFVDSSHIAMPGSDVDWLLNRVLPDLPAGAIVHIHDMLLPDPYPADWQWRGYNEQNAVMPLLSGGGFEVLFASHFVATRMQDELARSVLASLNAAPTGIPASLWLRKG